MHLRDKIEKCIEAAKFFDKDGQRVERVLLQKEYNIIKNHLVSRYSNEDIVAISFDKDYRYLLTVLACMSVGITYIPLNASWPKKRIDQIRDLSGCYLLNEADIDFISGSSKSQKKYYQNETLYIIFTSGSTGMPKGVKITREAYVNFINWCDRYFDGITSDDRMLLTTDFTFDISLLDIALLLEKNVSLYISNFNNNIFKMLFELEKYKITVHSTVPYNYSMAMQEDVYEKADLSSLKYIILAGARFPYNLYYSFKKNLPKCNVYNAYGPTEATIYATIHKLTYNEEKDISKNNISIGKPLDNMSCIIQDDELLISGIQLMSEYLNNESKTKEALVEIDGIRYYKSGDTVFQNDNNDYFVVGRKDDTIKVSGYRVNLSDIDAYVLKLDYINNTATIAIDKDAGEHDLACFVILSENKDIDVKKIKKDLGEIMPSYQVPKYIRIVDEFPLNNSGKICKRTLKNIFQKSH